MALLSTHFLLIADAKSSGKRMANSAHLAQLDFAVSCRLAQGYYTRQYINFHLNKHGLLNIWGDSGNIEAIPIGLAAGTVIAVADRSFKNQFLGTAAFTLIDENTGHRLEGANLVRGQPSDQSAHRSELAGLFGIMIVCKLLCQVFKLSDGFIEIACDGLAAGQHALVYGSSPSPTQDHFEMISAIKTMKQALPITSLYHHIEGHQKEKYPRRKLDKWAILNDKMDSLAKAFWTTQERRAHHSPQQDVAFNEWTIRINDKKICKNLKEAMRETIHSQQVQKWWVEKQHFTKQQIDLMDHNASKSAMGQVWVARKRWVCKFAANYAPVGRNMKDWKFWHDDCCPRCLSNNETARHVLQQCPNPRALQQRLESHAKFATFH
jgi:hypothetical protein